MTKSWDFCVIMAIFVIAVGFLGGHLICKQSLYIQGLIIGCLGVIIICIGLYMAYLGFTGTGV